MAREKFWADEAQVKAALLYGSVFWKQKRRCSLLQFCVGYFRCCDVDVVSQQIYVQIRKRLENRLLVLCTYLRSNSILIACVKRSTRTKSDSYFVINFLVSLTRNVTSFDAMSEDELNLLQDCRIEWQLFWTDFFHCGRLGQLLFHFCSWRTTNHFRLYNKRLAAVWSLIGHTLLVVFAHKCQTVFLVFGWTSLDIGWKKQLPLFEFVRSK